jgi:hypothetical protein
MGCGILIGIIWAVCAFVTALYQGWTILSAIGLSAICFVLGIVVGLFFQFPFKSE